MQESVTTTMGAVANQTTRDAILASFRAAVDRMGSQMYSNSTLVIKGAAGVLAKTGAAISYGVASGRPVIIGAGTDMPALTGLNIGAGKFNLVCFFVDPAGTLSVRMGIEGATAAAVKFPNFPEGKALVGFLSITYASAFVGNTTALDTATTLYFSPTGALDPSITL